MLSESERKLLGCYVANQLNTFFPDGLTVSDKLLQDILPRTINRMEYCFSKISDRYFFDGKRVLFNHLNGDQYSMFLYLLSNTLFCEFKNIPVCDKIFSLNKMLHGIDVFYEVALPDIFHWVHPLGTVLGRGNYGDYLLIYQRCGVGSNRGKYPTIGKYCSMHPGSSVLGNCDVGEKCELGADSLLLDKTIFKNSLYVGNPSNCRILTREPDLSHWRISREF